MIKASYKHTNIVSRDWQKLARFYEQVFGCVRVFPERHHSGEWLAKGTGVANAELSGVHLRFPYNGEDGPTLEIFQYFQNEPKLPPVANREGFSHIAFEVDDVERAMDEVLKNGGKNVGDMASSEVKGVGILSFVYVADPEGNIIELQSWKPIYSKS
jgi:catechol 2,3-dioxygenase-like lactoylglutathione lyase family enzyme